MLVELPPGLLGKALAVNRSIADDRNLGIGPARDEKVTGDSALLIVPPADAEDIGAALLGQPRVGRGGRHLDDPSSIINLSRRDRGARALVPDNERNLGRHEPMGRRYSLAAVTGIID